MMPFRETAAARWRQAALRQQVRRSSAGPIGPGRCEPRHLVGRPAPGRVAARQALMLRRQGAVLREEFQAVLGPIDAVALQKATQPLQDLPLEALVDRTQALLRSINERVAGWAAQGGLLAQAHGRLAPVLSAAPLLDQVRRTSRDGDSEA